MAKRTNKKSGARSYKTERAAKAAARAVVELRPIDELIRAKATGNTALELATRERLGLSSRPTYRDALVRTSRKVAR